MPVAPDSPDRAGVQNRDEALRCLNIAHQAILAGDLNKAERFAKKAQNLHPSIGVVQEVSEWRTAPFAVSLWDT
jgi:hypothetical protein